VDDRDAEVGGRGEVDDVEPGAVAAHHLQAGARGHQRARARGLRAEQDAGRVAGHAQQAGLGGLLGEDDARLRFELLHPVGMDGAGDDDEGGHGPALYRNSTRERPTAGV
jgi:hypothetical protein